MTDIAIENGPVICDLPIQIVIFHIYIELPEGRGLSENVVYHGKDHKTKMVPISRQTPMINQMTMGNLV